MHTLQSEVVDVNIQSGSERMKMNWVWRWSGGDGWDLSGSKCVCSSEGSLLILWAQNKWLEDKVSGQTTYLQVRA